MNMLQGRHGSTCRARCAQLPQSAYRRRCIVVFAASTALLRRTSPKLAQAERDILQALSTARGRGSKGLSEEQRALLQGAVEVLEAEGGVKAPTTLPALNGKWRLLYTSSPGTASPIQNTLTGVDAFSVYQEVLLDAPEGGEGGGARVNNIVDFGPRVGFLKVEAEASTDSRPIPGFVPRRGQGLPLFGKSSNAPPARPDMRIDFAFDTAAFNFTFLPFKIPYPVPFKLLGDETKGWVDVTYLNPDCTFRISRGNKGTLFILVKERSARDQLMDCIEAGQDEEVISTVEQLAVSSPEKEPARSPATGGTWRLLWSQQSPNATLLQRWGTSQAASYQIIDADGQRLQNRAEFNPWFRFVTNGRINADSGQRTGVEISDVRIELGPFTIPLPTPKDVGRAPAYIDWLYLDGNVRITRGSLGSLFIHERSDKVWT